MQTARTAEPGSVILCMLPDTGERYLSTPLFEPYGAEMNEEEQAISESTPGYRMGTMTYVHDDLCPRQGRSANVEKLWRARGGANSGCWRERSLQRGSPRPAKLGDREHFGLQPEHVRASCRYSRDRKQVAASLGDLRRRVSGDSNRMLGSARRPVRQPGRAAT
jgi:hypothetical protein